MSSISPFSDPFFSQGLAYPQPVAPQQGYYSQGANQPFSPSPSRPYGINSIGVQTYLPIQQRRALTPQEMGAVQKEQNKWWPKLYPGYLTPIPWMMANPVKKGVLSGLLTGLGALASWGFYGLLDTGIARLFRGGIYRINWPLGFIIAAAATPIAGVIGYFHQRQKNESLLDVMSRLPIGATKRDMLSDPAIQADLNREATLSASHANTLNNVSNALITLNLLDSLFNNGSRYRGGYSSRRK